MIHQQDEHFMDFIRRLEVVKAKYGENTDALQEYQVNKLIELERQFRKVLVRHRWGPEVYQRFIRHVVEERRSILMARPFFRERDETFKGAISPALKANDHLALTRFNVNFQFIAFAETVKPWHRNKDGRRLLALAEQVRDIRREIIECNLPLAISQARLFRQQHPKSHLTYMDLIQIATEGLAAAVDKFAGPWATNFRAVIIGRVLGNFIEANSETFVHFYPADKRRIYRARKAIGATKDGEALDYDDVLAALNRKETQEGDDHTTMGELVNLMAASQVVSAEALPNFDDAEHSTPLIEQYPADPDGRADIRLEEAQARHVVAKAILELPLVDQKLLRLKGVELS